MKTKFPIRITNFYFSCFIFIVLLLQSSSTHSQSNIEGIIWNDVNANGLNDNEQGLPSIPVFLLTCSGQFIQSTISSNTGIYSFQSVPDNNYKIFINKSSLPQFVFTLASGINHINNNGYSACNLTSNSNYTINVGLTILPSIGDKIWEDLNGNGLQEQAEPGIKSVIVSLYSSPNNLLIKQTTSDQNGDYQFTNIFPGNYYIKFSAESPYLSTIYYTSNNNLNSDISGANGIGTTDVFSIETGPNIINIDAGFYRCIKICGLLYSDGNFSNTMDAFENGINGLKVKLWQINAAKDTVLANEKFTSSKPESPSKDGYYEFCVFPGKYFLETIIPESSFLIAGLPKSGSNPNTYNHIDHSNGLNTTYTFNLQSGENFCNINNGFYCYGSIHVKVWVDYNGNGMFDNGEVPISEVPITLYNMQYQQIDFQYSNINGDCYFSLLKNGDYFVYLNVDPALSFTLANAGDDDNDNDIDNSFGAGTSNVISVTECKRVDNLGAGVALQPLPLIWDKITATNNKSHNTLDWKVRSQINTSHFIILKNESSSKLWDEIGIVEANNGIDVAYSFSDYNINNSKNANYKIVSVDFDGNKSVSKIVTVNTLIYERNFSIQPVPANDFIEIIINKNTDDPDFEKIINIYNATGSKVKSISLYSETSIYIQTIDLPVGLYKLVVLEKDRIIESKTFSLVR